METVKIKIGTRGSKLALAQVDLFQKALVAACPHVVCETIVIQTSGDWKKTDGETKLSEVQGGKGLFAKEIEQALLAGAVDIGVHSLKDMPSFLPDGLVIDHVLPREDPRDAFLSMQYQTLDDLPDGAVIGSSSVRRIAMIRAKRPDLKIEPLRGNIDTRLQKLKDGQVDATYLAVAGLKRIGLDQNIQSYADPSVMIPAAGQGAVCIERLESRQDLDDVLRSVHCVETGLCVFAERAVLQVLDGSCHTPIGAYACLEGDQMTLNAVVASEDGQRCFYDSAQGIVKDRAEALACGEALGQRLKERLPDGFLA